MNDPLTPLERAERVVDEAKELGLDGPTELMIARVVEDAEFDTLNFPNTIRKRHGLAKRRTSNTDIK